MGDIRMVGFYYNSDFGWESTAGANEGEYVSLDDHNKAVAAEVERLRSQFAESEIVTKQISDLLSGAMTVGKAQRQHIAELTAEIERLKATRELVDATRISNDLTAARIRISQLEAALAGCAGQWTPEQHRLAAEIAFAFDEITEDIYGAMFIDIRSKMLVSALRPRVLAELAERDATIADQAAEIERLRQLVHLAHDDNL